MMASSSAMTTRIGTTVSVRKVSVLGRQAVEKLVLSLLELVDGGLHLRPVPAHRLGMTLCFMMLAIRDRRFGHERAQSSVIGGLGELEQLLVGDEQLGTQLLQPLAH